MAEKVDLSTAAIDPACAARLPAAFAMRRLVLPLCVLDGEFAVAMADASDEAAIALVEREAGRRVRAFAADPAQLREALLRLYGDGRRVEARAGAQADEPVAAVERILRMAALRRASDVHFEPGADGLRVRFRVDGALEDVTTLPSAMQPAVTSRLKVLAGLDIAERRAPQDGAFQWRDGGAPAGEAIDVRAATLPVRHGERVTLRLLEAGGERLSLDGLGLSDGDRAAFEGVLESPHGLVLLSGPTGSGKTTTLYAAIQMLMRRRELNILTVEDPIEYEMPGVSQAEVDAADKVNFAKALRSLLRHDPDVIMIGEIRDAESLDAAVKAALTGHLVLSTLHANDAVGVVTRLSDMGLDRHLAAATLRLSAAQRLVRALCPHCREEVRLDEAQAAALGDPSLAGRAAFAPRGCVRCAGRGYRGRTGLFELFAPDAECASMIAQGAHEAALLALARGRGMRTLADDARAKCLGGVTTVREALRVTR